MKDCRQCKALRSEIARLKKEAGRAGHDAAKRSISDPVKKRQAQVLHSLQNRRQPR